MLMQELDIGNLLSQLLYKEKEGLFVEFDNKQSAITEVSL